MNFRFAHLLSVFCVLALIALIVVWNLKHPTPTPFISIGLGILLLMPGIWPLLKAYKGAFVYYALLMLLYFSHAIVSISTGIELMWGFLELALSLALFYAALVAAKLINRARQHPSQNT